MFFVFFRKIWLPIGLHSCSMYQPNSRWNMSKILYKISRLSGRPTVHAPDSGRDRPQSLSRIFDIWPCKGIFPHKGSGGFHIWCPQNFRIFLPLPPVTVANQQILFLLSAFWVPPTHCGRHIWKPPQTNSAIWYSTLPLGPIDVDRQWECHIGNGASLIWTTMTTDNMGHFEADRMRPIIRIIRARIMLCTDDTSSALYEHL